MTPPLPGPAPEELRDALAALAAHRRLLVCLDFDGCVAELAADPEAVAPVPANAAAIEALAGLDDVAVAYVSGRPLEQLRRLAAPPASTLLVGSHGAEQDLGDASGALELTAEQERVRARVLEILEDLAADVDGALVERKPAGAALHVRAVADAERAEQLLAETRRAMAAVEGAHPEDGKMVVETTVVHATKGEAIELLRAHTEAGAVLFAGDDVTDEQGFAVLRPEDLGIKVGAGETLAAHRIPEPADLAVVLTRLAEARGAPRPVASDQAGPCCDQVDPASSPGSTPDPTPSRSDSAPSE